MSLENWKRLSQPPKWALKQIQAGRLKGKSDINPQWRYQAMTEVYGECGCGWKYRIDHLWNEEATEGQRFAFAQISLQVKCNDGEWSDPIPGIGGHMLLQKESKGLHVNDEAYKMAVTDALSTAMKMLGVAADVYAGLWDGAKYVNAGPAAKPEYQNGPSASTQAAPPNNTTSAPESGKSEAHNGAQQANPMTKDQQDYLVKCLQQLKFTDGDAMRSEVNKWLGENGYEQVKSSKNLTEEQADLLIGHLEERIEQQPEAQEG